MTQKRVSQTTVNILYILTIICLVPKRLPKRSRNHQYCQLNLWRSNDIDMKQLRKIINTGLDKVCHQHHRYLAGTQGLKTSKSKEELAHRLTEISLHDDSARVCKSHPDWFTQTYLQKQGYVQEGIYRSLPRPAVTFSFNASQVFERCLGPGMWARWLADGTLIAPNAFAYLSSVQEQIDHEFDMYRHHLSLQYKDSRRGWLRNMYYSVIQQVLRQDPLWYAVTTSARFDKQWRLIAFPYYTKDTDPGESLAFKHLDINLMKYIDENADGSALLSSSIAFDDEDEDNCTTTVLGFHRFIRQWANRLLERGDIEKGFTGHSTNCNQIYRSQDQRDFGNHTPTPCPAFGLRITRPDVIHGSTSGSIKRRRSAFAWFSGVKDDHSTLDGTGTMTWGQVANCHRDHAIPLHEPSGQQLRHAQKYYNLFPATVGIDSTSALGDALIGRRKWTDPAVLRDRNIVLGNDDEKARWFIQEVRTKLVAAYIRAYDLLVQVEIEHYSDNSYFKKM